MKTQLRIVSNLKLYLSIILVVFLSACSSDDNDRGTEPEPTPNAPALALEGSNSILVKNGQAINVTLNLTAPGGSKELVVNRGGGLLETIALTSAQSTVTYNTETVPADSQEGDVIAYQFILVDLTDQESTPVALTVNTTEYDTIEIGGETLFDITITDDGIVPSGTNVNLITGRNYFLSSSLSFEDGTSLTIEEGVTLYLDAEAESPIEVRVDNGASISVIGTPSNPIVMTSSATLGGTPASGDWSRFRLGNVQNGTFQYVRSEYADEGLRFGGVDNTNTVDHITSFFSAGEGIYVTGGNVNIKYAVAVNSGGGSFRFGDDYAGKVQFLIGQIDQVFADNEELSIRETSTAVVSNITLIGPGSDQENTHGARLRASSQGKVYSAIITAFPRRGIRLNDDVLVTDLTGQTVFAYSYIFDVPTDPYRDDTANGNLFQGFIDDEDIFQNPFFNNVTGFDLEGNPILEEITGVGTNDFIPEATVTAKNSFDPNMVDAFFTSVTFVGAVENEANDWTTGWVKNPDGSIR